MSDVTHAKVKFEEDKSIKVVPIDKIVEFRDAKPVDTNDFDRKALYKCLWSDEKNPEEVELAVQISDLAVIINEEDLQSLEKKRGRFPKINDTIINEFYDELDNDDGSIKKPTSKKSSVNEKNALIEKKRVQTEILNEKMKTFVNSNSLLKLPSNVESTFQENSSDGILVNIEKEKLQYDYSTLQERFNELLENHNNLKKKYSSLEKENANLRFLNQNLQLKLFDPPGKCNDMQDQQTVFSNKSESKKKKQHKIPDEQTVFSDELQSKKKEQLDLEISAIPPIVQVEECEKVNYSAIPPIVQVEECEKIDDLLHTSSPILSQGQCHSSKEISKTDLNDIPKTNFKIPMTDFNDSIDNEMAQGYQSHCSTPARKRLYSSSPSDTETSTRHISKKLHFDDHESQKHTEEKKIENYSKMSTIEKKVNKGKENKSDNSLDKADEKKTNKSKEKHEKKRTEKSNDDHENNEIGQPEFLSKSDVVEDGKTISKIYLGEGIYINRDSWNDIVNVSTSNRFIVALLKEFYTPQQLSKRSLSGSETWKTPNGVHTRKKLSSKKYRVIQKCTKYYLRKRFKLSQSQIDKEMSLINKHITSYISKVVNSMKSNKTKETKIVKESEEDEESE